MNITRVCELAAVVSTCRHESTVAIGVEKVTTIVRWCIACGALRSLNGWLVPTLIEDIGKHLVWVPDPPAVVDVDPRQIPLPLGTGGAPRLSGVLQNVFRRALAARAATHLRRRRRRRRRSV